jgi:hypothetical protein
MSKLPDDSPRGRFWLLDRVLDSLLIHIPILLTLLVASLALRSPLPRFDSGNEFDDWLLNATLQAQHSLAWQLGADGPQAYDPYPNNFWRGPWNPHQDQFSLKMDALLAARWDNETGPDMDQRLIWMHSLRLGEDSGRSDPGRRVAFLQELRREQGLSKLNQMQLADALFNVALKSLSQYPQDHNWNSLSNFGPKFAGPDSWMSSADYEEISAVLSEAALPSAELGFPCFLDAVRLLNAGQYDEAFAMFETAAALPAPDSGPALLNALNVSWPQQFDDTSSSMLDAYVGYSWNFGLNMEPDTLQRALEHCLLSGDLDSLQLLQQAIWNMQALRGLDWTLALQQQLLTALPQSLVVYPGNTAFREARRDVPSVLQQVNSARYPVFNASPLAGFGYIYDELESKLASGRPTAYVNRWAALYGGYTLQNDIREKISTAAQQDLQELEKLDWSTLVLPESGVVLEESASDEDGNSL